MYKIDQSTQVQEVALKSTIPVGINDNCELVSVGRYTASNGSDYLGFLFKDANGSELKHMEWDVDPARVTPKPGESVDECVTRRINQMLVRIKHIATKFIPENQFVVQGNNFGELVDSIVRLLAPNTFTGKKLRLKVVYSYNDYCSLPNFAPFVEDMAKDPSGLKINPKYDKMEKSTAAVEAQVNSTDEADLPF
tara:strand:- start:904 stop:1485 length:582 start_codon:yes stop_codon:yes gene_type:complete